MAADRRVNLVVARVIPFVLGGLLGYSSYVFTKPLCIDYFINPPPSPEAPRPRRGLAIGLLTGFYFLLVLFISSYLRVLTTILLKPGFLPRGNQWAESQSNKSESGESGPKSTKRRTHANSASSSKSSKTWYSQMGTKGRDEKSPYPIDSFGLEAYYCKDIFVCQQDGRPSWCSTCCQWKTDRAHHCSEAGRCIRKLDHFCPWVGGVISEYSFKYFIQFLFYTSLFTAFNVVVLAIFVAERKRNSGHLDSQWLVDLALCGLFFLFSLGMLSSSLHLAWMNSSTIESLTRRTKVWTLAILIPRPKDFHEAQSHCEKPIPVVIYPGTPLTTSPSSSSSSTTISTSPPREFAILSTEPGENPFDLGSPLANMNEVMGHTLLEWLLPLRPSPCTHHDSQESAYAFGPVVQRLKKEAGLI